MKKKIIALMGVTILSVGMLAGCGGRNNTNNENDTTNEVTSTQDITEETTLDNVISDTNEETTSDDASNSTSEANDDLISEAEAKNIAVKDAGIKEGDITNIRIEMDFDDGRKEYEVDFYVGNKEYDYTISAEDGAILEKDTDIEDAF